VWKQIPEAQTAFDNGNEFSMGYVLNEPPLEAEISDIWGCWLLYLAVVAGISVKARIASPDQLM
jgi:hypothetical protein